MVKAKKIIGSRKSSSTLKSAVRKADLYIGNCDTNVTEDAILEYIRDQADVKIDSCKQLETRYDHYRSFKVTLSVDSRRKLLESEFWPEGIVCRKYYNPRQHSNS